MRLGSRSGGRRRAAFGRRHLLVAAFGFATLLHAAAVSLSAQVSDPVSPRVSAADSAAVLVGAAERFLAEGQAEAADVVFRYVLEHFSGTPAAARALAALGRTAEALSEGSGRVELQVWGTTFGLWLGIAVPAAFDANGSEAYGIGLLLGGPAGFLAGSQLASARRLSTGQARAITLGGTWGTWQGWGWSNVLDLRSSEDCFGDVCYVQENTEARFAAAILGGLAGAGIGTALSRREISPGHATTVNFGALWGTWFGVASGVLLDLENDALLASALLGGDVGLLATALAYPGWELSRSRARIISIAGVMGGLGGAGLDLLIKPESEKTAIAIPLVTSIAGLAIGAATSRGRKSPSAADPSAGRIEAGSHLDLGALLQVRGGGWSVGVPLPAPIRLGLSPPGHDLRVTQWRLPVFSARF